MQAALHPAAFRQPLLAQLLDAVAFWREPAATATVHRLQRGQSLVVECPQDHTVVCHEGLVWITHDGEPDDTIVEPGTRYVPGNNSRMLVHAVAAARVALIAPVAH